MTLSERPDANPDIHRFLSNPVGSVNLAGLPSFWKTTRITFIYKRPADLEVGVRLASAFRGALGNTLQHVSSERRDEECLFGTAFDALFGDHFKFHEGWHVPKPFVIWVRDIADKIYVEISLFGDAGFWRDDIIEAALRIMLPKERGGQGGISLMTGHRSRRVWEILDLFWRERGNYPIPRSKPIFILSAMTPFVTSAGNTARGGFEDIVFSIFSRLSGLVRWQGLEAKDTLAFDHLRRSLSGIGIVPVLQPRFIVNDRKSRSYGAQVRQETGYLVDLKIYDYPQHLWPGFVLGTLTHAGYDVSQGYGRYQILDP